MADGESRTHKVDTLHQAHTTKEDPKPLSFSDVVRGKSPQLIIGNNGQPSILDPSMQNQFNADKEEVQCNPTTQFQGKIAVLFPIDDKAVLVDKLKYVLIGKFSHGRPPWLKIKDFFTDLKLVGSYNISIFDKKHIFIECSNNVDFNRIWLGLLWIVDGCPMRILKWVPEFSPLVESPIVPVWIRMEGIPLYMFEEMPLWHISNAIGKPIRIDSRNLNRSMLNTARVCVELDISKPLVESFWVCFEDKTTSVVKEHFSVDVYYDYIPSYCTVCSHVGHKKDLCKRNQSSSNSPDENQEHKMMKKSKITKAWAVVNSKTDTNMDKGKQQIEDAADLGCMREQSTQIDPHAGKDGASSSKIVQETCLLENNNDALKTHENSESAVLLTSNQILSVITEEMETDFATAECRATTNCAIAVGADSQAIVLVSETPLEAGTDTEEQQIDDSHCKILITGKADKEASPECNTNAIVIWEGQNTVEKRIESEDEPNTAMNAALIAEETMEIVGTLGQETAATEEDPPAQTQELQIQGAVIAGQFDHKCTGQASYASAVAQQTLTTKIAMNESGTLGEKKVQPIAHYVEHKLQNLSASTSTKAEHIGQLEHQNLQHPLAHSGTDVEISPQLGKESRSKAELTPKSAKEHEWQLVVSKKKRGSREKDSKATRLVFDHNIQDVSYRHSEPRQAQFIRHSWADQVEEEQEQPTLQQTVPNTKEDTGELKTIADSDCRAVIKADFLASSASIEATLRKRQPRLKQVTTEDTISDKGLEKADKGHMSATKESKEDSKTTMGEDKPRQVHFHGLVTIHLFEKEEDRRSERLIQKHTSHTEKEFRARVVDAQHNEGWPLRAPQGKQAQTPGKKAKSNDPG